MGDLLFWLALQAIVVSWGLECPRPPCFCFDAGLPEEGCSLTVEPGRACVLVERPCNHDQCTQFPPAPVELRLRTAPAGIGGRPSNLMMMIVADEDHR